MANSLNQVTFFHAAPALAAVLAFAVLVYLLAAAARRRLDARAAVVASIWIVGCLFYVDLFGVVNDMLGGGYSLLRSLPVALALLGLFSLVTLYLPAPLIRVANLVLNAIALVLFVTPAWQAVAYEWRHGDDRLIYDPEQAAAVLPTAPSPSEGESRPRPPDIYHFVFDRFTSADVLAEHYELDIAATLELLEERGFYVADHSFSNYHRTAHSLASTFYMDYLDLLAEAQEVAGNNWQPVHRMLGDHRVARFLKARGYDFLQFGSWWTGTFRNPVADENRPHGFSEFNMLYLRRTMLRPIFHALPDSPLTMHLDWDNAQCQRIRPQLEEIKALGERERPVYVFAHILLPHGPYNFSADGECLTQLQSQQRGSRQGYIDQARFASRIIEELVSHLLAEGRAEPVILIHADEGPFPEGRDPKVPWQELPNEQLRIKTAILNAYYLPDGQYEQLNEEISPVNSFRVIFNALFGTDFEILTERTFVSPDDRHLYDFHDVTDRVRQLPEIAAEGGEAALLP